MYVFFFVFLLKLSSVCEGMEKENINKCFNYYVDDFYVRDLTLLSLENDFCLE